MKIKIQTLLKTVGIVLAIKVVIDKVKKHVSIPKTIKKS